MQTIDSPPLQTKDMRGVLLEAKKDGKEDRKWAIVFECFKAHLPLPYDNKCLLTLPINDVQRRDESGNALKIAKPINA